MFNLKWVTQLNLAGGEGKWPEPLYQWIMIFSILNWKIHKDIKVSIKIHSSISHFGEISDRKKSMDQFIRNVMDPAKKRDKDSKFLFTLLTMVPPVVISEIGLPVPDSLASSPLLNAGTLISMDNDFFNIKLENGYNISVKIDSFTVLKKGKIQT